MSTGLLVFLTIIAFLGLVIMAYNIYNEDGNGWDILAIICQIVLTVSLIILAGFSRVIPTAMDVYEGKTEIKYDVTIRGNDTIITDSTVVFKTNK
jgi:hypothetical protein